MSYRPRRVRRVTANSKKNVVVTIALILIILYGTLFWILPWFVQGVGVIKDYSNPPKKTVDSVIDDTSLAPPVFTIPYEATNSSKITISGYATYGTRVKIFVNDTEELETDAKEDSTFIAENISLNQDINTIYGTTIKDGKESLSSKNIKIIFDKDKPSLQVSEPEDNRTVQGERKLKISGKSEAGVKVYINNSQVIIDSDGNFSAEKQLNDGENIFEIKAEDQATNATTVFRKVTFTP